MKIAALDLGSNTFLCLIAEVSDNKIFKTYSDHSEVVRLGQNLATTGSFHPEALARAEACLMRYSQIIKDAKPDRVLAMATSAARDSLNKEELFKIAAKYGVPLEIIPGEKEAQITYKGAVSGSDDENCDTMVIDVGGGSTEVIFGRGSQMVVGKSFDIGCVRLTEKYIGSQPTQIKDIMRATAVIDRCLQEAAELQPPEFSPEKIIAVAGTPTALVAAEFGGYNASQIDGYKLDRAKLNDWFLKLTKASVEEKIAMGIPAGRADVILIGVIILLRALIVFDRQELTVSTRGVRYGVALELFSRS